MIPARRSTRFDLKLPHWVALGVSGTYLLLSVGPFAVYGREYLLFWALLTVPFCWLPLDFLPSELSFVLTATLLAASTWAFGSYLVADFVWRRIRPS